MTFALPLQEMARAVTERTVNSLLGGVGIAVFAWMLLHVTGRRNSSTRFAVWLSALVGIAALPWLGALTGQASAVSPPSSASAVTVPASWALDLFLLWAAGAGVLLVRIGVSLWQIQKLRRECRPLSSGDLAALPHATLRDLRSTRAVTVALSDRVSVPTAVGFFSPVILLPAWIMKELSPEELNAILIHELAHLQRRDDWTNLLQKVLRALFFFHPGVWWVEKQLSVEREMACDDVVLAHTANPRAYAECLISVAEKSFVQRGLALAQAAVGRMHQTAQRIAQILDAKRSRATQVWKPALGLVAAFSAMSVAYVASAPELVAFRDPVASIATASVSPMPTLASYSTRAVSEPAQLSVKAPARSKRAPIRSIVAAAPRANVEASVIQAKLDQNQVQFPTATLVVFQQYDGGNVMWTVYVWRVTVVKPTPAQPNIPAKQI